MKIYAIDHVQLAMPANGEEQARAFYGALLGFEEKPKPLELARRGGVWFENEHVKIHLGVEADFRPARKAHPALLIEGISEMLAMCREADIPVVTDEPLEGYQRFFLDDPFGNRLEFLEPSSASADSSSL